MSTELFESRKRNAAALEAEKNRKPAEYRRLFSGLTEGGRAELLELAVEIPKAKPIIEAAAKKYPPSEMDPPNVQKAIQDFHVVVRTAREICNSYPARIQRELDRIEAVTADTFRFYSAKTLFDCESPKLSGLLNCSAYLAALPAELGRLEARIKEAVSFWADRTYTPPASATVTRSPLSDKQIDVDEFDSRL